MNESKNLVLKLQSLLTITYNDSDMAVIKEAIDQLSHLQHIVDSLPHTADNVPVYPTGTYYYKNVDGNIRSISGGQILFIWDWGLIYTNLFATFEHAEQSKLNQG